MEGVMETRYLNTLPLENKIIESSLKRRNREENNNLVGFDACNKLSVYTYIPMLLLSVTICVLSLVDLLVCTVIVLISQVSQI